MIFFSIVLALLFAFQCFALDILPNSGPEVSINIISQHPVEASVSDSIVNTITNTDGTLIISQTTGDVTISLNLANPNTWTALQTFQAGVTVTGGGLTDLVTFSLRDLSASFNVILAPNSSSVPLTANHTLTWDMGNVDHTIKYGTTSNTITYPNDGNDTVAMLNVAQTFTQKQTVNLNAVTPALVTGNYAFGAFGADGATAGLLIQAYNAAPAFIFTRANGTGASPTVLGANNIFTINGRGFDGSAGSGYSGNAAQIVFSGVSSFSTTNHETAIILFTTPNNSITLTEALHLFSSGGAGIGGPPDPGVGKVGANVGFVAAGNTGQSVTTTVRAAGGAADCTIIYTGGIKTGGTC